MDQNARTTSASPPDLERLPDEALLTRRQLVELTGYAYQTFKVWAKQGRGPQITYVEGRPRTTVRDYRAWIAGTSQAIAR